MDFLATCRVAPENVWVIALVGIGLFTGGALSILTGVTYIHKRKTRRDEEPLLFWLNVALLLGIGGALLLGLLVCRRG